MAFILVIFKKKKSNKQYNDPLLKSKHYRVHFSAFIIFLGYYEPDPPIENSLQRH